MKWESQEEGENTRIINEIRITNEIGSQEESENTRIIHENRNASG